MFPPVRIGHQGFEIEQSDLHMLPSSSGFTPSTWRMTKMMKIEDADIFHCEIACASGGYNNCRAHIGSCYILRYRRLHPHTLWKHTHRTQFGGLFSVYFTALPRKSFVFYIHFGSPEIKAESIGLSAWSTQLDDVSPATPKSHGAKVDGNGGMRCDQVSPRTPLGTKWCPKVTSSITIREMKKWLYQLYLPDLCEAKK